MSRYYTKPVQYPLRRGHENKLRTDSGLESRAVMQLQQSQAGRLEADGATGAALMQPVVNLAHVLASDGTGTGDFS